MPQPMHIVSVVHDRQRVQNLNEFGAVAALITTAVHRASLRRAAPERPTSQQLIEFAAGLQGAFESLPGKMEWRQGDRMLGPAMVRRITQADHDWVAAVAMTAGVDPSLLPRDIALVMDETFHDVTTNRMGYWSAKDGFFIDDLDRSTPGSPGIASL